MRITQAQRLKTGNSARAGRTAGRGGGGFQVVNGEPAQKSAEARAPGPVGTVDALVALQTVPEGASERRRRAVERGGRILDQLEELKLALLSGRLSDAQIANLRKTVERDPDFVGDPGLQDVLRQIDLRARVELAKINKNAA